MTSDTKTKVVVLRPDQARNIVSWSTSNNGPSEAEMVMKDLAPAILDWCTISPKYTVHEDRHARRRRATLKVAAVCRICHVGFEVEADIGSAALCRTFVNEMRVHLIRNHEVEL